MWVIRRLKTLGADEKELLDVLCAQVLSVLNFASPAWSTQITAVENTRIESVLKTGLYLVYGERYGSFSLGLAEANMSSLFKQRSRPSFPSLQRTASRIPSLLSGLLSTKTILESILDSRSQDSNQSHTGKKLLHSRQSHRWLW